MSDQADQADQPQPEVEKIVQKTQQQLQQQQKQREEQQRQRLQEEKQRQQQKKKFEQEAKIKLQQDKKKLQQALKNSLSGLSKTVDNRSLAYCKLNLGQKELDTLFPSILKYSHIRYLDLNTNNIKDISIILNYTHLVSINLLKNQIEDISIFNCNDKLKQLQFLNLSGNKLKILNDITLPSLRKLNLNQNQITNVNWKGHQQIQILQLRKNKLKKLQGLANMKNLQELYICENQITDIRGLEGINNLCKLSVRNNKIKKILNPFPYMPALKDFNLRENQLSSLDELKKIHNNIQNVNFIANPLAEELGQNVKREVIFVMPHLLRVNKSQVSVEDRINFHKQWLQKMAQLEKQRIEKQAQQQESRKAALQQGDQGDSKPQDEQK